MRQRCFHAGFKLQIWQFTATHTASTVVFLHLLNDRGGGNAAAAAAAAVCAAAAVVLG
jgi:hypothetical protein